MLIAGTNHFSDTKSKASVLHNRCASTPCPGKKGTNSILGITSSNTDRFLKFFQCHNLLEICNKTVIKSPTTPQMRRYTTL